MDDWVDEEQETERRTSSVLPKEWDDGYSAIKELMKTLCFPWKEVRQKLKRQQQHQDPNWTHSKQSYLNILREVMKKAVECYNFRVNNNVFANDDRCDKCGFNGPQDNHRLYDSNVVVCGRCYSIVNGYSVYKTAT